MRRGFLNSAPKTKDRSDSTNAMMESVVQKADNKLELGRRTLPFAGEVPTSTSQQDAEDSGWAMYARAFLNARRSDPELPERDKAAYDAWERAGCPEICCRFCQISDGVKMQTVCVWLAYRDLFESMPKPKTGYNIGPLHPPTPLPLPYRIAESTISGAGMGMLATRNIAVGETILIERPLVIWPQFNVLPWQNIEGMFEEHTKMLSVADMNRYLALANCKPASECGPLCGRMRTNAIQVEFPASTFMHSYGAVCLEMSRCNHSCGPNTTRTFDPITLYVELRATRAIVAGEEITLSYASLSDNADDRQEDLQTKYLFKCKCQWCALTGKDRELSDSRRKKIAVAVQMCLKWEAEAFESANSASEAGFSKSKGALIIKTILNSGVLDMIELEGLELVRGEIGTALSMAYLSQGNMKEFKKWSCYYDMFSNPNRLISDQSSSMIPIGILEDSIRGLRIRD